MVKAKFTKKIEKGKYIQYREIAKQFLCTMTDAHTSNRWNAVGLNGVHASISITDSILANYKGIRSSDSNHIVAADLLVQVFPNEEGKKQKKRLEEILRLKNVVSYEGREFTKKEADKLTLSVTRFFDWAEKKVT